VNATWNIEKKKSFYITLPNLSKNIFNMFLSTFVMLQTCIQLEIVNLALFQKGDFLSFLKVNHKPKLGLQHICLNIVASLTY